MYENSQLSNTTTVCMVLPFLGHVPCFVVVWVCECLVHGKAMWSVSLFLCALRTLREGYYYAESNFTLGVANRFLDNSSPHPIVRSTDPIVFHCGSIRKNQLSPGCSVFGDCRFSSSAGLDSPFFLLLQNLWFLLGFFKSPGRAGFFR